MYHYDSNMKNLKIYSMGVDIGSTTIKVAILDDEGNLKFSDYRRHNANIRQAAREIAIKMYHKLGNCKLDIVITGSVGMGYSSKLDYTFVQEVVASAEFVKQRYPQVHTFIDMGGEDSKMIFFEVGKVPDIRMNGSCAGGTGAFIDQTASLLGISPAELSNLAESAETIYPIASRCGVFSKTDIQNLISRSVSKNDIAASVFHAVALQVVASLARGTDIKPQVFFCGGPFAFLPALKKSFIKVLELQNRDCVLPEHPQIIPALGCALLSADLAKRTVQLTELLHILRFGKELTEDSYSDRLEPLFSDVNYEQWEKDKIKHLVPRAQLKEGVPCYLGVDSGSTTTKIVLLNQSGDLVYSDYRRNEGDSFLTFSKSLQDMHEKIGDVSILGTAATGYGENLLKTAYNLDLGLVETIAHYTAARSITPNVSFVLDIGGQDMKAIFIDNDSISRIEINEACSSGCGSFIETFASMLGYKVDKFAEMSCHAQHPCDLGTRCTVFMNSKVKQAMREGAKVEDIAAGFSYSVVKNCLFKVLKLKTVKELGSNIVVQGGTFKNHSIVRALEVLTGKNVAFSDIPELMGAYGAALYAKESVKHHKERKLSDFIAANRYEPSIEVCQGCENHCTVKSFTFQNGNTFYSGNNCERVFSNISEKKQRGVNMYAEKYRLLFNRISHKGGLRIGIPRGLGVFENFPFWHALFTNCGFEIELSKPSTDKVYGHGVRSIMADNICFPAKLMHGHVMDLIDKKVDRIFYPYVVFEKKEDEKSQNSFNCPIVTGYSDVLKSSIDTAGRYGIQFDAPVITFNDEKLLEASCLGYLKTLSVPKKKALRAIELAKKAQNEYLQTLTKRSMEVLEKANNEGRMVILLAGRPYHADPFIEHKISHAIADMGIDVITENIAVDEGSAIYNELNAVSQWAYPNRIFKAASFVANSNMNLHYVELTSFGCGPDAFILDEVGSILKRRGKNITVLKIDDVNNIGSLRLRIRSLVESLKLKSELEINYSDNKINNLSRTKVFTIEDRKRTIIAPYFAEGYSEFLPSLFKLLGYNFVNLPMGNQEAANVGLKHANNEICYPSTIVIGSIIMALQSGKYNLDDVAVIITQTGGQCRASNYLALIKDAVVEAGYTNVPVLSLEIGGDLQNSQPGFTPNWKSIAKITIYVMLYADCINKLYYASVVRENQKGISKRLKDKYTKAAFPYIEKRDYDGLLGLLKIAVKDFTDAIDKEKKVARIGIVGEIYVKYNAFSNQYAVDWLINQGIEVVAPSIYNFFTMTLVNSHINKEKHIKKEKLPLFAIDMIYMYIRHNVRKFDKICKAFPFYQPFSNIFKDEKLASKIVNTAANFGEGWLIPAELSNLAEHGVHNVVSMQPFGCIANHVISKGIEKRIKELYPQMSLLFLDFDGGTSEANVFNRLHFMVENCKKTI